MDFGALFDIWFVLTLPLHVMYDFLIFDIFIAESCDGDSNKAIYL